MFGVGGIAFGFAAQQTISNLISGLMLLLSHPFQIGDHIQAAGVTGWVIEIGLFHTYVNTDDHVRIMLPNSKVLNSNIINHSRLVARQVSVTISTSDEEDVAIVRKELKEAVTEVDAKIRKRIKDSFPIIALDDVKKASGKSMWRAAGVEGRGRPLSVLKPGSVFLVHMQPKEKVLTWRLTVWASSDDTDVVKNMLLWTVMQKFRSQDIKCS
mmetsp:Transcript_28949/g.40359  ORF Transcript_28949/g.40359 Transcript_28949/m.40359 type:complete len:212 (+) Transcript_28949:75-710(+)